MPKHEFWEDIRPCLTRQSAQPVSNSVLDVGGLKTRLRFISWEIKVLDFRLRKPKYESLILSLQYLCSKLDNFVICGPKSLFVVLDDTFVIRD